ncbi:hypothetical protein GWO43_15965 [candidate division KSB1 bacterium]|nr:hypothetical protein [candidate division KSB1 bacterium]NIV68728.1 hypothetical protein [Phycisphaerae bacterium]NIS25447.1 hypothetical protein [candidate division KSB1 bacterium]NIT72339.1 hypothetical protein [candidate division KSB1 bacterium]NIU26124.1 hypothetical protein [candidate division KSB1 bacterium]
MAWVQNRREQFTNHWFVVDDNGNAIGEEYGSRAEAEAACANINNPPQPEPEPKPKRVAKKRAKKK